jgi:hypothetical protein
VLLRSGYLKKVSGLPKLKSQLETGRLSRLRHVQSNVPIRGRLLHAILVFIDGTICDRTGQFHLSGTEGFFARETILKDKAVPGAVSCLSELALKYNIIYMGARPTSCTQATKEWLLANGFPDGPIHLAATQSERLSMLNNIPEKHEIIAGIGDRWDDNELHLELGCLSIILQENHGNWGTVRKYLRQNA